MRHARETFEKNGKPTLIVGGCCKALCKYIIVVGVVLLDNFIMLAVLLRRRRLALDEERTGG